jgi:hypothetical protein
VLRFITLLVVCSIPFTNGGETNPKIEETSFVTVEIFSILVSRHTQLLNACLPLHMTVNETARIKDPDCQTLLVLAQSMGCPRVVVGGYLLIIAT